MHLLIVEDDSALGNFLEKALKLEGHVVARVEDGDAALRYVAAQHPELMLLDLGLPRRDGLDVLAEMAAHYPSTSVLILTARSDIAERVRCLELGAEDIVMKPFSFHELRARLKSVGRRRNRFMDSILRVGPLEMDRAARRVTQAGREIALTATEFSLLESLMRRRGERVCSRSELMNEVWPISGKEIRRDTNILEVYINYLRKKLGRVRAAAGESGHVIRTIRSKGYLLTLAGCSADA